MPFPVVDAYPVPRLGARGRACALLLAVLAIAPLRVQGQPPKLLTKPDAEFPEPFTVVSGIRELQDGRLVVIDSRDKIVQVIDFKSGNAVKVGREGSGPGEYAFPMRLVPLPGDSSGVYDMLNSRMLVVLPNGKPGPFVTIEQPQTAGPGGGMVRIGGAAPRFADSRGRLYWTGQPFTASSPGEPPKPADSVPVLRYDRASKKTDSIAWLRVPKASVQSSGGGGNVRMMVGMANPFEPRDEWAVTPDGHVLVFRSPDYRVEWYRDRQLVASNGIPYERSRVTEWHKERWRQARRTQSTLMVSIVNGQRSVRSGPPPADVSPGPWPEFLPPFLEGAAHVAAGGRVWLERVRAADARGPVLDVFSSPGRPPERLSIAADVRVVGVGDSFVYAVRTDQDDLQYLQRYAIPARP